MTQAFASARAQGLEIRSLAAGYGGKKVMEDVSFDVAPGEMVALLGINGAGKSTCLNTLVGLLKPLGGSIRLGGMETTRRSVAMNAQIGLVLVPEGARSFQDLSVRENLEMGGFIVSDRRLLRERFEEVLDLFPRLRERLAQLAGTLSGGERQMLGIGRALMLRPKILLLDEPFLGLAPVMIGEVVKQLDLLKRKAQCGIVIAEQHIAPTLRASDSAYLLRSGRLSPVQRDARGNFDEAAFTSALFST